MKLRCKENINNNNNNNTIDIACHARHPKSYPNKNHFAANFFTHVIRPHWSHRWRWWRADSSLAAETPCRYRSRGSEPWWRLVPSSHSALAGSDLYIYRQQTDRSVHSQSKTDDCAVPIETKHTYLRDRKTKQEVWCVYRQTHELYQLNFIDLGIYCAVYVYLFSCVFLIR